MVKTAWVVLLSLVSVLLAGCVSEPEPVPNVEVAAPQVPTGPGWVRVLENDDPDAVRLYGFELALDADDWERQGSFSRTNLVVAPFGNLTGWALLLFDEGRARVVAVDMPGHGIVYPTGTSSSYEAAQASRSLSLFEAQGFSAGDRAVLALVGAGGVAIRPDPEATLMSGLPDAEALLAKRTSQPTLIGTGTGMAYGSHMDLTVLGVLGARTTYGDVAVDYRAPVAADMPGPLLDVRAVVPAGLPGWGYTSGAYLGSNAHGLWEAEVAADESATWNGLIMQDSHLLLAEALVFGLPLFAGQGDTATPLSTTFDVRTTNVDQVEMFLVQQLTLGAPLVELIGVEPQPFNAVAFEGIVGGPEATFEPHGHDLTFRAGGVETTLFGALPPGTTGLRPA